MHRPTRLIAAAGAVLLSGGAARAQSPAAAPVAKLQSVRVQWLGHATFEIVSPRGTRIVIDPFITGNPATPDSLRNLKRFGGSARLAAILVTHAHSDHAADAKALAQLTGAPVISAYEYVGSLGLPEAQSLGGNVGGTFHIRDVTIHLVPAIHSSEPGRALGFVIEFADGRTLYDTGDTWLFGDMALIQELYHPDIILLGVGGGPYTEDPATAALAVRRYFRPRVIVPMHYGTFPGLATEAQVRQAFAGDKRLAVMTPGETRQF